MKMKRKSLFSVCAALFASTSPGGIDFDAGADLRVRQELMKNVPGLPGGGVQFPVRRSGFVQHMRFRPRIWGEAKGVTASGSAWRLYARLADEFRWCPEPCKHAQTFPGEVFLDNLFFEGRGLFDGFLDLKVGRQDLFNYCGLDHVFDLVSPGDGSRSFYSDMATFTLHLTEESTLDLFALYNFDDNEVRFGTERSKHTSMTGFGGGADLDMDDWGVGAIWRAKLATWLPYQVFVMQKNTHAFLRAGEEHPWTQRELVGTKLMPQIDEEWSLQFEAMGQVGVNGDHETLSGWSSYAGVNWKRATASSVKPFGKFGYHFMSGDDDAADEDGGHSAWDPMWARGVSYAEIFLYGTHYGFGWWSNLHAINLTAGLDLGRAHRLAASLTPMFAAAQDGLGGGDGFFKGVAYQAKYDFPIRLADKAKGERLEVVGHLYAEFFNPGDYFETGKPAFFLRWQVEFKF